MKKAVLFFLVLGIFLRFWKYWDKDYFLDEFAFLHKEIEIAFLHIHYLLPAIISSIVVNVFGYNPIFTRFPAFIFSSLSLIAFYKLVETILSYYNRKEDRILFFSVAFFSTSYPLIATGYETKILTLHLFTYILTLIFLFRYKITKSNGFLIISSITSFLSILSYLPSTSYILLSSIFFIGLKGIIPALISFITLILIFFIGGKSLVYSIMDAEKHLKSGIDIDFIKVLLGQRWDMTFYVLFLLLFIGFLKASRNVKVFATVTILIPSIINSAISIMGFFDIRYILPIYIALSIFFSYGVFFLIRSKILYIIPVAIIISNIYLWHGFLKIPSLPKIPLNFSDYAEKIKEEKNIFIFNPLVGELSVVIKAFIITTFSFYRSGTNFLAENRKEIGKMFKIFEILNHFDFGMKLIDDISYPENICFFIPNFLGLTTRGWIRFWNNGIGEYIKKTEEIGEELSKVVGGENKTSIGIISFCKKFSSKGELIRTKDFVEKIILKNFRAIIFKNFRAKGR